ncbi:ABC transporter permease [Plantibacter sp. YIM 135249]|jgi:osmoprotectant transport system permease protein|uniref:ABC transporter permease n=1 Tax=Plantibacter sp. YIM 135249 TaxID=3423918 RepID=UPI003D32B016
MNNFIGAFLWIFDPAHWSGANGIPVRVAEHLGVTALTVVIACVIAIPLGLLIGHTGKGREVAVSITGALRALPTLGLLSLLALVTLGWGFASTSLVPAITALVVLAIPPVLAGAYGGVEAIDKQTVDAARAVGMNEWQILGKVEIPLALPLIIGGIRSAVLQTIATATVAAFLINGPGLGRYILDGLPVRDYAKMLAGSILIVALALILEGVFALIQRAVIPRGVAATHTTIDETRSKHNSAGEAKAASDQAAAEAAVMVEITASRTD